MLEISKKTWKYNGGTDKVKNRGKKAKGRLILKEMEENKKEYEKE